MSKTFYDAEAIVTGYLPGKGKHKGSTGALKCRMASGKVGRSILRRIYNELTEQNLLLDVQYWHRPQR